MTHSEIHARFAARELSAREAADLIMQTPSERHRRISTLVWHLYLAWAFLIAAVALSGCGHVIPPHVDFPAATAPAAYAWDVLQCGGLPMPRVIWLPPAQLNCDDGTGWMQPTTGLCIAGEYHRETGQVWVAYVFARHPEESVGDTALPHELAHACLDVRGHDMDFDHRGPLFRRQEGDAAIPGGGIVDGLLRPEMRRRWPGGTLR